jgi:CubicO group peptidase (beta-lactamase class C family)
VKFTKTILVTAALAVTTCLSIANVSAGDVKITKAEQVGMSSERLKRINTGMNKLIAEGKIPGAVTLVARRGKVVHFEASGLRDVERKLPMEKDTIFRLYSQSKPVTGAAVMILFEEGHFLLSDPVSKYLPEFSSMNVYVSGEGANAKTTRAQPITIHQLLTHTSGLSYPIFPTPVGKMYVEKGVVVSEGEGHKFRNLQEWSERLVQVPLVAQPGSEWNYSAGMDVLGRLVEVISGKTFGEFLQERIFGPLSMVDTGFHVPKSKLDRFAANYTPTPAGGMQLIDDPKSSSYSRKPVLEMGGSGLVGTVGDYLKFAQMLGNKGEYAGVRILGKKTVEFMTSNHLTPNFPDDPLTSIYTLQGKGRAWGMGFGLTGSVVTNPAIAGLPVSKGTYSWGGAATTHFWVDHEEELVGLVHTQLLPDGTYPVIQLMQLLTYQAIED